MSKDRASALELATAYGVLQGKTVSAAMRDAGYAKTTVATRAGKVEERLRGLGLLPTPESVRDTVAEFRATIMGDDGHGLKQAWLSTLSRAQAGDIAAMRFIMEYLAGRPSQPVAVTGAGGGPVETVTRVVFEWSDANDIPPDDADAGDDDAD